MSVLLGPTEKYEQIHDKDKFEKELLDVLQKALRAKEERPKEKHVRKALISTWREKGTSSFWKSIHHFPIIRAHVICWKTCFIIHRMFRDGHPNVIKSSVSHMRFMGEVGKHWNESLAGYAPLISAYIRCIMTRVSFIIKNPEIPGKLSFEDKPYEVPADADHVFSLSVEVFDLQSSLLHFYSAVLSSLDPSQGPMSDPVQCRLAPLIPAIQDSATLYDIIFKLMKTLHAALPADVLQGHRDRFNRQYSALRKYFIQASKMKYLQSLVQIPILDPEPPSFLLAGKLIELELAKRVRLAPLTREDSVTSFGSLIDTREVEPSPPPEPEPTPIPRPSPPKQRVKVQSQPPPPTTTTSSVFDSQFSSIASTQSFDFNSTVTSPPVKQVRDDRDDLISQLMREIVELKEEIRNLKEQIEADHTLMSGLRSRLQQLEAELNDYKDIAEQTCSENVLLKRQIEASTTEQGAQNELETRAKVSEEKFVKLRDVYHKLRSEHIVLLRTNGESQKQVQTAQKEKSELEDKTSELEKKVSSLMMELEEVKMQANDESAQVTFLRDEIRRKEAESVQLEKAQKSLSEQLEAKSKGPEASHSLVENAVTEAENLIRKVLTELDSPSMAGSTCTPGFLLEKTKSCLDAIDNSTANFSLYNNDPSAIGKALSCLPSLSHCIGEVILQGVATSHLASTEDGKKLVDNCKTVGEDSLKYLAVLKLEKPGSGKIAAGANDLQKTITSLQRNITELVPEGGTPNGQEEDGEGTLADLVDEELASTAQAVETAARRIQQMLEKSREDDTGVKLEVNERLLDSCTGLMKAIKVLIARSKELQSEIVGEGIGVNSNAAEFYKKNSRWSEGLISAAKQVGWGASVLVDAADKVVTGTGKFEELVVASHDIAASTAQLVAASRVKARPRSEKLKALKASSRDVTDATGQVVASAQSGSELSRQGSDGKFDYSKLSLTQAKRLEMESQVRALELEKELRDERTRLAELRKVHYHLAGASEGWEVEDQTET